MKQLTCLLLFAALFAISCRQPEKEATATFTYHKVVPQDFPTLDIPGFSFPEDSTRLNGWIRANDTASVYRHGWGIWTGLTAPSSQTIDGDTLLVFETWMTPEEMIDSIKGERVKRSNRANLKVPNQFFHGDTIITKIHESVSYSPPAAAHAIRNKLFMATALAGYAQKGMTEIPNFPTDAITIKPVFKVLSTSDNNITRFPIPVWHGTTDQIAAFGEKDWQTCVYVDIKNQGKGNGSNLPFTDPKNPPAPTPEATYNLTDFVYFILNAEDAYFYNQEFSENQGNAFQAKAGDIAILMGMHVTTRENKRWTWQSFWWAPDANNPPEPSSKFIADQRPAALTGAPRHYAMTTAYYMVNPEEPYYGKDVTGQPHYGFNPYLEAGFGPRVFKANKSISYVQQPDGNKIATDAGVRTNCMSCHIMATVNPDSLGVGNNTNTNYIGNAYISLDDPLFIKQLKLDFAWSIEGNVDTTGWAEFLRKSPVTVK